MTWIAVAIAGGSLVGGLIQGGAAQSAAQTQAQAAQNAQQISLQEFNTITGQEQPFMQGGYGALSQLEYLLGITPQANPQAQATAPPGTMTTQPVTPGGFVPGIFGPTGGGGGRFGGAGLQYQGAVPPASSISGLTPATSSTAGGFGSLLQPFTAQNFAQLSPAYNFQRQQGLQGVVNADATGQGALSGATLKDLIGYNQNLANTSFANAFNQYQTQQGNIFNRLSGIAQLGQAAAANTGQQGTALAGQAAQSATNIGTALAGGQVGMANAITGGISGALPWLYASQNPGWLGG